MKKQDDSSIAVIDDKGNEKSIKKVVGINQGRGVTVELTDGTEVFIDTAKENSELKVLDREQEMLLAQSATMGSPENANAFIKSYQAGQDIEAYAKEWRAVQQSKAKGEDFTGELNVLSPAQADIAAASKTAANTRNTYSGGAKLVTDAKLSAENKAYVSILNSYGKKHGIRYHIVDKLNSPSGRKANAQFKSNSNVITIALDSDQPMLVVAGHETFHYLKDASPENAKTLQNFVVEKLKASKDFDYDKRFNELAELYNTVDEDVINEEIAANAMFDILTNEKAVRELAKNDKTLFDKIKDIIEKIIKDLKSELNRYFADKAEARALKDDIEALEKVREMFYNIQHEIDNSSNIQPTNNDIKYSQDWGRSIEVGKDINEFHNALTKTEWNKFYHETSVLQGTKDDLFLGKINIIIIGKKIIIAEVNQSGNYSVRDVFKFNTKDFKVSDFKELIKEINKYGYDFSKVNLWLQTINDAYEGRLFGASYRHGSWDDSSIEKTKTNDRYDDRKNERITNGSRVLGVHSDDISARNLEYSEIKRKFSLQENEETTLAHESARKDNKELEEAYKILKNGIRLNKSNNPLVAQEFIYNAAESVAKKWGIIKNNKEYTNVINRISDVFKYLSSPQADINSAINSVSAIAKDVIPSSADVTQIAVDNELQFVYDSVKQELKGTYIYLNNKQVNQIFKDHKSLRNYTQNNTLGKLIITTDPSGAVPIDEVWNNLTQKYPELFDEADKNTDSNQIIYKLVDFLNAGVPMYQTKAELTTADIDTIAVNFAYDAMIDYAKYVLPKTVASQNVSKLQEMVKRYEAKIKIAKRTQKNIITRKNAQIEKTKKHYQNRIKQNRIKREDTKKRAQMRANTMKSVNKLITRLNNPTDKNHIQNGLEKTAEEFVKLFHGNSMFFDESQINKVIDEYQKIQTSDDDMISRHFDSSIIDELNFIKEFAVDFNDTTTFAKISAEATQAVEIVTEHLFNMIENADKMFRSGKTESYKETGTAIVSEVANKKLHNSIKKISDAAGKNITPYYFFKKLGKNASALFSDMVEGQDEAGKRATQTVNELCAIVKKHDAAKWIFDNDKTYDFKTERDKQITVTLGELMSIYATSKREATSGQESHHLSIGGIILNKLKKSKFKGERTPVPVTLSLDDQLKLSNMLTKEQRLFVDDTVKYMSTTLADWGNETSLKLHGYKKFLEKYYFPYSVSKNHIKKDLNKGEVSNSMIANKGMTKATRRNAATPIYINDFADVVAKHIKDMVEYNTMAIPQKNIADVINYIDKTSASGSMRQAIEDKFGSWAVEYYETLVRDISGGVQGDINEEVLNKFLSKFKKTAVAANLRVVIQQPSALPRAMMMIDPKYFATNPFKGS